MEQENAVVAALGEGRDVAGQGAKNTELPKTENGEDTKKSNGDSPVPPAPKNGLDRCGEFGVIGEEQEDESHFDTRRDGDKNIDPSNSGTDSEEGQDQVFELKHSNGTNDDMEGGARIQFSNDKLYGRDVELRRLDELWESHQNNATSPCCAAMISGYSGCGKTRLVEKFVSQQQNSGKSIIYLRAKYSQTRLATGPLGCFGSLFDNVLEASLEPLRKSLRRVLSTMITPNGIDFNNNNNNKQKQSVDQELNEDEARVLLRIFPGLLAAMREEGDASGEGDDAASLASSLSVSTRASKALRSGSSGSKTIENKKVLQFVLQKFFRLLCANPKRPVFLVLDDLQWADDQSFLLIQALLMISEDENQPMHLFLIGSFRSNEVDEEHKLKGMLKSIEEMNENKVPVITLPELSLSSVTQMIADSLQMEETPEKVEPLAEAIYAKTLGNPLFTRQALEQLANKNAIYWDSISFSWAWNLRQQELQDLITDDIIEMIQSKISQLDPNIQHTLQVAACTGPTVDVDTLLELIYPELAALHTEEAQKQHNTGVTEAYHADKKQGLIRGLDQCVSKGLLVRASPSESYSFAHDRIEEASRRFVYDKMRHDKRSSFLGQLGKSLYKRAVSDHGEDWMFFTAAQHLNEYDTTSTSTEELNDAHVELAMLNNITAKLSLELLAFESAAKFASKGIVSLLALKDGSLQEGGENAMWVAQGELAISLHTVGAEAEYGQGNTDQASTYCNEILKYHEKNRYDIFNVLPSILVHLDILAAKGDKEEAFQLAFSVLDHLGFWFPSSAQTLDWVGDGKENKPKKPKRYPRMLAAMKLKEVKAKYIPTENSIDSMPRVSDPQLIETFDILHKAGSFAYQLENIPLYVMVYCEALKWMNKNGMTDASASAIASFANALMHVYGDFETGARLAELAICLVGRIQRKFHEPRALNTASAFVLSWVRPLRMCLKYHSQAIESGRRSGNIEGAAVGKMFSSWNMMYSALPLGQLESFCRAGLPPLRKMELHFDANLITMVWQTSLNLMGRSENTVRLVGEAMNEHEGPYAGGPFKMVGDIWRRYLCAFFGEWEEGAGNALAAGDSFAQRMKGMKFGMETAIRGILLVGMARKDKSTEAKYKKGAQPVLKQLQIWIGKGCVNIMGPTKLIEAEMAVIDGKKRRIRSLFQESISISLRDQFHQYAGLAHERFAFYLIQMGDKNAAKENLSKAINLYQLWGAQKKVELLRSEMSALTT